MRIMYRISIVLLLVMYAQLALAEDLKQELRKLQKEIVLLAPLTQEHYLAKQEYFLITPTLFILSGSDSAPLGGADHRILESGAYLDGQSILGGHQSPFRLRYGAGSDWGFAQSRHKVEENSSGSHSYRMQGRVGASFVLGDFYLVSDVGLARQNNFSEAVADVSSRRLSAVAGTKLSEFYSTSYHFNQIKVESDNQTQTDQQEHALHFMNDSLGVIGGYQYDLALGTILSKELQPELLSDNRYVQGRSDYVEINASSSLSFTYIATRAKYTFGGHNDKIGRFGSLRLPDDHLNNDFGLVQPDKSFLYSVAVGTEVLVRPFGFELKYSRLFQNMDGSAGLDHNIRSEYSFSFSYPLGKYPVSKDASVQSAPAPAIRK